MMIKQCNQLIRQKYMHIERAKIQQVKKKRLNYTKIFNFDDVTKENIKQHNQNWPQISDHPNTILINEGSGSGKINSLFNLINQQPDTDKIYLYANNPCEENINF